MTVVVEVELVGFLDAEWNLSIGEFQNSSGEALDFSTGTFAMEVRETTESPDVLLQPTVIGSTGGHLEISSDNEANRLLPTGLVAFSIVDTSADGFGLAVIGKIQLMRHATRSPATSAGGQSHFSNGLLIKKIEVMGEMGFVAKGKEGQPGTEVLSDVTVNTIASGSPATAEVSGPVGDRTLILNLPLPEAGDDGFFPGLRLTYSDTITEADPGDGYIRFNNATFSSITQIYIDNLDRDGATISGIVDLWDDISNSAARGFLDVYKADDVTAFRKFRVTGSVTDETGYRKVLVTPVTNGSAGTLANDDNVVVFFQQSGADGADGFSPATVVDLTGLTDTDDHTARIQDAFDAVINDGTVVFASGVTYRNTGVTVGNKSINVVAEGATLVQTAEDAQMDYSGGYGTVHSVSSITNADSTMMGNATRVATLAVSAAPSDLSVGDTVKVFSDDKVPKTVQNFDYRIGEHAVVAEISGSNVLLTSTLYFNDVYSTNIRVAKVLPNRLIWKGGTFTVDRSVVDPAQPLNAGQQAHILCRGGLWNKVETHIKDAISNAVVFHGCCGYEARVTGEHLPDDSASKKLGYLVTDQQSEFGRVGFAEGVSPRHAFTTNNFFMDSEPHSHGSSAYFVVKDGVALGGMNSGFNTHAGSHHGKFINCRAIKSGARSDGSNNESGAGFSSRGDYIDFINCSGDGRLGFYIWSEDNRTETGVSGYSVGTRLINCTFDATRLVGLFQRAELQIIGGRYWVDPSTTTTPFSMENADLKIRGNTIIDYAANVSGNSIFFAENGSLDLDGATIVAERQILNGSSQLVNWGVNTLTVDSTSTEFTSLIKNIRIEANVPLGPLISDASDVGDHLVDTADVVLAASGNITCNDSTARDLGLQGNTYSVSIVSTGKTGTQARNVTQRVKNDPVETRQSAFYDKYYSALTDINNFLEYATDHHLVMRWNLTSSITITDMPAGNVVGQTLTLMNATSKSNGHTLRINESGSGSVTWGGGEADHILLEPKQSVILVWDRYAWVETRGDNRTLLARDDVADLPSSGLIIGETAYANDGRRSGETAGNGSGCPVWWDGSNWLTFYDSTTVAA